MLCLLKVEKKQTLTSIFSTRLFFLRSVALSKDLDDEEEIESPTTTTTASFIVLTEQRAEKPWIVLDVVVEEDEFDEIAIEDRRSVASSSSSPFHSFTDLPFPFNPLSQNHHTH